MTYLLLFIFHVVNPYCTYHILKGFVNTLTSNFLISFFTLSCSVTRETLHNQHWWLITLTDPFSHYINLTTQPWGQMSLRGSLSLNKVIGSTIFPATVADNTYVSWCFSLPVLHICMIFDPFSSTHSQKTLSKYNGVLSVLIINLSSNSSCYQVING